MRRSFGSVADEARRAGYRVTRKDYTALLDTDFGLTKKWVLFPLDVNKDDRAVMLTKARGFWSLQNVSDGIRLIVAEREAAQRGEAPPPQPRDDGDGSEHSEPEAQLDEEAIRRVAAEVIDARERQMTESLRAVCAETIASLATKAIEKAAAEVRLPKRVEVVLPTKTIDAEQMSGKHVCFTSILQEIAVGNNVFLSGPAGSGKTTAAEQVAEVLDMEMFLIPPPSDPYEIFGHRAPNGEYHASPVWRALTCGKPCLLVFDEIDRSDPRALCAAHPVLAGNGVAAFPHAQIPIPTDLRIICTANTWGIGPDAAYVGACKLDDATLNRFPSRIFVDYDVAMEERVALANGGTTEIVRRCQGIRQKLRERQIKLSWTPRDTFALCRRMANLTWDEAIDRSVLVALKPEQKRMVLA